MPTICHTCGLTVPKSGCANDALRARCPNKPSTGLAVGDRISDNDPRMTPRVLTITEVLPNGVRARDSMGNSRLYLRKRIFTDGKPRRSGFSLLKD